MDRVTAAAQSLMDARKSGQPVDPITSVHSDLTLDEAYAIQMRQVESWLAGGQVVRGHKVGLTSRAMQRMLKVDQPDYGHLTAGMFHPERSPIATSEFIQPRIEPEIGFVLSSEIRGPGVTAADALRAVDFVIPALEIIDSRIQDWNIGLLDTIADNASCGGVVLGAHPTAADTLDLRLAGCNLYRNGQLAATGAGGAVLGSPLSALVWLANTLGERDVALEKGQVVLPGSCTQAIPVAPGDVVSASFAGLGTVTAIFN